MRHTTVMTWGCLAKSLFLFISCFFGGGGGVIDITVIGGLVAFNRKKEKKDSMVLCSVFSQSSKRSQGTRVAVRYQAFKKTLCPF